MPIHFDYPSSPLLCISVNSACLFTLFLLILCLSLYFVSMYTLSFLYVFSSLYSLYSFLSNLSILRLRLS
jgi:hypothetical protein